MTTEVLSVTSEEKYSQSVRKSADVLRRGGLVAFPTETVYGLAASAEIPEAVARLRRVRGRLTDEPLTVHVGRSGAAEAFLTKIPGVGRRLMTRGWPGPLTLVLEVANPQQAPIVRGKDSGFVERVYYSGSVGLRYPDCAPACDVINQAGCVVVASSANRSGHAPPTAADQVLEELDDELDLLLDGQQTRYAGPSTIAGVREQRLEILREGVLEERVVRKMALNHILLLCTGNTCRSPMAEGLLKAMLAMHLECEVSELPQRGYKVRSAGTAAIDGLPATPEAVEAMADRGIDISGHRSTALTREVVEEAQVILVMTAGHKHTVERLVAQAADKNHLLGGDKNIEDPIGGPLQVYQGCRDQIAAGLEEHFTEIIL